MDYLTHIRTRLWQYFAIKNHVPINLIPTWLLEFCGWTYHFAMKRKLCSYKARSPTHSLTHYVTWVHRGITMRADIEISLDTTLFPLPSPAGIEFPLRTEISHPVHHLMLSDRGSISIFLLPSTVPHIMVVDTMNCVWTHDHTFRTKWTVLGHMSIPFIYNKLSLDTWPYLFDSSNCIWTRELF